MTQLQFFSLRRISGRIFWGFITLVLVFLINGIANFYFLSQSEGVRRTEQERLAQLNYVRQMRDFVNQESELISIIAGAKDPLFIPNLRRQLILNSQAAVSWLPYFNNDPSVAARFQETYQRFQALQTEYDTTLNAPIEQAGPRFNAYTNLRRQLIEEWIEPLLEDRTLALDAARTSSIEFLNNSRIANGVGLAVTLLLAVLIALLISRNISGVFALLTDRLRRISEGKLPPEIEVKGNSEVDELLRIFNRTTSNLKQAIEAIQQQSGAISVASSQIDRSSRNQAISLSEQSVVVTEVSATVEELSDTSQQIADSAASVAISATNALRSAEAGYDTLIGASQTMAEIRQRVNQIADRILALNAIAQRIRETTALIDRISNETHLLALNAAIESAGAGEEGARFSIVAQRVRKLAQNSRAASIEIQQLVTQIQQAMVASVMATEEGIKITAVGEHMVDQSLQANSEIIVIAQQTNQLAQAISLATDQQRLASSQVAETMRELASIIADITTSSVQYSESAGDLSEVVDQLNAVATSFEIETADVLDDTAPDIDLPSDLFGSADSSAEPLDPSLPQAEEDARRSQPVTVA